MFDTYDANGNFTYLSDSSYNAETDTLPLNIPHLSIYGIAYNQKAPAFTDITNHWTKDKIESVAIKGLLIGSTTTTFSPVTCGMLVRALAQLAEVDEYTYVE